MAAAGGSAQAPRQYKLAPQSELRVEVLPDGPLRVRLVAGTAEIFGTELPPEGWVPVPPRSKVAIFTWHGATVELDGVSESEYTSDETPMVIYVNTHAILDARRSRARAATAQGGMLEASQGPRVIVVGPTDSGKSTLCKMLLSWAAKQGWKPTYVDLDIGQGSITIPGCISATPIEKPIDIVDGIPLEMPLAYFYGHPNPSINPDVYKVLMKELAQTLDKQFSGNSESRAAGMIINTMGWVEGLGYELLLNAIETFEANVVLVLGQEKLWKMLKDAVQSKPNIDVVKLHKSEGVVLRNPKYRQKNRSFRIKADVAVHQNIDHLPEDLPEEEWAPWHVIPEQPQGLMPDQPMEEISVGLSAVYDPSGNDSVTVSDVAPEVNLDQNPALLVNGFQNSILANLEQQMLHLQFAVEALRLSSTDIDMPDAASCEAALRDDSLELSIDATQKKTTSPITIVYKRRHHALDVISPSEEMVATPPKLKTQTSQVGLRRSARIRNKLQGFRNGDPSRQTKLHHIQAGPSSGTKDAAHVSKDKLSADLGGDSQIVPFTGSSFNENDKEKH
ncbi:hypothetical protein GUJ93_ZPchr0121g47 [Zizania palustris]|uniref:Protein CLP1 homolog n=1 Tax=Zizania palustris TaxID=103762 RepID=A0A8J5UVD5_ZIZPA|nr:hypothetical protein GUJ93_ZPchr0121g47 [Zizania palustris]